jgi:transposase
MAAPYSLDLRERVVAAVKSGLSRRAAAERFKIGVSTAIRWTRRMAETGSPAALPMGGKRPFALATEADWVLARLREKPDITLQALLGELHARGVQVSYYGVWHFVTRAGLSFKKKPARQRTGSPRRGPPPRALAGVSGQG